MQIELSEVTAQRIVLRLQAAGIPIEDRAGSIQMVLQLLSESPGGITYRQIAERLKSVTPETHRETALDVAERLGLVGAFSGPADLSTNAEHMNGFGQ